jgi:hypothetical protein
MEEVGERLNSINATLGSGREGVDEKRKEKGAKLPRPPAINLTHKFPFM